MPRIRRWLVVVCLCPAGAAVAQESWPGFARNAQHSSLTPASAQNLNRIRWQTPVDLAPQYSSSGELLIHYGSPLVTAGNTVIVPVKTGAAGGFRVDARRAADGVLKWSQTTDYILPAHQWTPIFGPTIAPFRVYFPGAGGTVYYQDDPDLDNGDHGQIAFYGLANYQANAPLYNANVLIDTPITADSEGNLYFGFLVLGPTPAALASGIARISASGAGSWAPVTGVSGDPTMLQVAGNCAPALSVDGSTLYFAVSNGSSGYLVAVDSKTLAPVARVALKDPKSGNPALITNNSSASPTVGPDGDVYYGVLENPSLENIDRGWLLHFDGKLSQSKTTGAFGWDDTPSVVPAGMVAAYRGKSSYLLMTKYNNYADTGGTGANKIAILDPNATETDPVTGMPVMQEVLTVEGVTPNPPLTGVKEWCIDSAAVDYATDSVLAGSEDGKLYRWNLATNTLSQSIVLTPGIGEAYTPTVVGPDGTIYAINDATLFAVGQ